MKKKTTKSKRTSQTKTKIKIETEAEVFRSLDGGRSNPCRACLIDNKRTDQYVSLLTEPSLINMFSFCTSLRVPIFIMPFL